jgi:hypothetical protein
VALMVAGDSRMKDSELPVLPPERLGVDGLLGVDMLEQPQRHHGLPPQAAGGPSQHRPVRRLPGVREVSVLADARFGRLAVANARVSGVRCVAFIDSGSGASMGNMAWPRRSSCGCAASPSPPWPSG